MKNHTYALHGIGNTCLRCGLKRKRATRKIMNFIKAYSYTAYAYQVEGKWTFERPECTHTRIVNKPFAFTSI